MLVKSSVEYKQKGLLHPVKWRLVLRMPGAVQICPTHTKKRHCRLSSSEAHAEVRDGILEVWENQITEFCNGSIKIGMKET